MPNGPAFSDIFELNIDFNDSIQRVNSPLQEKINLLLILCKEISFPSKVMSLANAKGTNLGEDDKRYPYASTSNELEATFIVDADLLIIDFFNTWMEAIYRPTNNGKRPLRRFAYPEDYYATGIIKKFEKGNIKNNDYTSIMTLYEFYPYAQDIIPMSYSKKQPMDLTMRFAFNETKSVFAI